MDIFERVKNAALKLSGSEAKFAEKLGLTQQKLNRYLRERSSKLWDHLPVLLSAFPDVNRDWLYFGEGEMLKGGTERVVAQPLTTALPPMRTVQWRVQEEAADEVAALRVENGILKDKLIAALEDNKLLHEQLARVESLDPRMAGEGKIFTPPAGGGHAAPGASVQQSDFTEK